MRKNHDFLIIIPAYNEEKNISATISSVRKFLPTADIIVVDDGSKDNTSLIAKELGITVLKHTVNLGDGAARQTGFKYALSKGYHYLVHLDADGQHDAAQIPDILADLKKGDFDVIIGSRFLGNRRYKIPVLRRLGMGLFSRIVSTAIGKKITDPTSGFRGINKRAMEFYVNSFYPEHYPDADVIIASHYAGLKVKEIPVQMSKRTHGVSLHSGLSPVYYIYKMCLSIFTAFCNRLRR